MIRSAWITGAGKGIGREVALGLARRGASVAVSARTEDDLRELERLSETMAGAIHAVPLDVTDEHAVLAAFDAVEKSIGPIDLVLLNAGTHIPISADGFNTKDVRSLVEANVMGVVHGLAAVLPAFIARRAGHIAVMSSVAGYRGLPTAAGYGATKAALINMCESLKPELAACDVTMTVINPGFVRTPLTDRNAFRMPFLMDPRAAAERVIRGLETGRFEITFPRRFTWGLKLLRCLPYALYFPLTRRLSQ